MRLRTQTLRPGTRLYHGTSGDFHPADLRTPAWFSDIPEATDFFQTWNRGDGKPHRKVYIVTSPLRLLKIVDNDEMSELQERAGTDDINDLADWVLRQGYAGWIIPDNYNPGADIMLGSVEGLTYEDGDAERVVEALLGS